MRASIKRLVRWSVAIVLVSPFAPRLEAAENPVTFTEEEIRAYARVQEKLKPKEGNLLRRLQEAYPGQKHFTEYEIAALERPGKKVPLDYDTRFQQKGRPMRDSFTAQAADAHLRMVQKQKKATEDYPAELRKKFGEQDWYTAEQVRDVAEHGSKPRMIEGAREESDPIWQAAERIARRRAGFRSPKVRESWRDVLLLEDPSQTGTAREKITDVVGATFSFNHDFGNNTDTWTAIGAVILPWEYENDIAGGWTPENVVVAPSVSINKVDTNGDPEAESDSLLYRLGAYAQWRFPTNTAAGLQLRSAIVYATDTGHDAEAAGFELELEPRWRLAGFPIGYRQILIRKAPLLEDGTDMSALEYKLRFWLRAEGGDVQRSEETWETTEGRFLRLGPALELAVTAPYFLFHKDLSITVLYSHLEALRGVEEHESFFKATASLELYKNALGHRISLNADYQNGGLDFTKEQVESFTIGLGVVF